MARIWTICKVVYICKHAIGVVCERRAKQEEEEEQRRIGAH